MKNYLKRLLYSLIYEYKDVYLDRTPITRDIEYKKEADRRINVQYGRGFEYVSRKYISGYYVYTYKFTYRRRR